MTPKILCSGNPNNMTVARGIKQFFPTAEFASRNTGYDLRLWSIDDELHFKNKIIEYNVFINSSFISNGAQQKLLETTRNAWQSHNIVGYVINIGSTAEYEGRNTNLPYEYCVQKRALKELSLMYNSNTFKTTHITIGGINDGQPGHENWISVYDIASIIKYVIDHNQQPTAPHISIIGLD